jgi:hypothetical protein
MKSVECEPLPVESAANFLSALDLVVSSHDRKTDRVDSEFPSDSRPAPPTAVGRLSGFSDAGVPLVEVPGANLPEAIPARAILALQPAHIGCEVVLCFATRDWRQPIILGLLIAPAAHPPEGSPQAAPPTHVELNGRRLEFTAQDEIVLRCGKASITLTQAGKVLIRGDYLLSRSSGVNRIKGGSVQIN